MRMNIKSTIQYFSTTPKSLFLIDSLGAALTAFWLFFVLRQFHDYIGMPLNILTYLSVIGLIYCIYSTSCFFLLKGNWKPFLIVISIGNMIYCALIVLLLCLHFKDVTQIGFAYFLIEIVIIMTLAYAELMVANSIKN